MTETFISREDHCGLCTICGGKKHLIVTSKGKRYFQYDFGCKKGCKHQWIKVD